MAKAFGFDEPGLKRVIGTVREVERMVRNEISRAGLNDGRGRNWFAFKNNAGETISGHSIIAISSLEVDGIKTPILVGDKPGTTFRRLYAVVSPVDVAASQYGLATLTGMVLVKYDTGTPFIGSTYGAKPAQFTASSSYPFPGLVTVGIVDSTNKILLAKFVPPPFILCKPDSSISKGASGTVSLWTWGQVDTTMNSTAAKALVATVSGTTKFCQFVPTGDPVESGGLVYPGEC